MYRVAQKTGGVPRPTLKLGISREGSRKKKKKEVLSDRTQKIFWHNGRTAEGSLEPSTSFISATGSMVPNNGSLFK